GRPVGVRADRRARHRWRVRLRRDPLRRVHRASKRDPRTGELHAVSYFFGNGNKVQYSVIDTEGRARRTVDIEVTGSPMMHDFSLTEKHVVFYDLPVTFSVETAAARIPARMRTPAKLVMSAVIGKVRVPDPITAMMTRQTRSNGGYPYRWNSK